MSVKQAQGVVEMKQIICLGSSQGSDRLGWDIAAALERRLAEQGRTDIVLQACATPAHLPGMLADTTALLLIDALAGAPAGTVLRLTPEDLQSVGTVSSHGVDVVTALELARALGDLPERVDIVGIGIGDPLCAAGPEPAPGLTVDAVLPEVWRILIEVLGPL
ncbi:MAG TPA: hydrogenase maturation protease [Gammaproteobacteria bacterium]